MLGFLSIDDLWRIFSDLVYFYIFFFKTSTLDAYAGSPFELVNDARLDHLQKY